MLVTPGTRGTPTTDWTEEAGQVRTTEEGSMRQAGRRGAGRRGGSARVGMRGAMLVAIAALALLLAPALAAAKTTSSASKSGAAKASILTGTPALSPLADPSTELFEVEVELEGTGFGTVTSTPTGINCGPSSAECAYEFEEGVEVILTPTPEEGSEFVEWEGCTDEVGATCHVTAAESVTAVFNFEPELNVEVEGEGEGTVQSSPAGIDACGEKSLAEVCSAHFKKGTTVTLTPTVKSSSEFIEWKGCPNEVGTHECEITMEEEQQEVTAVIYAKPELNVEVEGSGNGTVSSNPPGINACGYASGVCYERFPGDTTVELTPTVEPGSEFVEWKGCTTVSGETCKVAMVKGEGVEQEVTAVFALYPVLEVELKGTGEGTVESTPGGIECGPSSSECAAPFQGGTAVTLTATPEEGSEFVKWENCPTAVGDECKLTTTKGKEEENVTAVFNTSAALEHPLTVSVTGKGEVVSGGTIKCKEGGSAGECAEEVQEGATVKLEAKESGWKFKEWTGVSCNGGNTAKVCEFPMPGTPVTVDATFTEPSPQSLTVSVTGKGEVVSGGTIKCKEGGSAGECAEEVHEGEPV